MGLASTGGLACWVAGCSGDTFSSPVSRPSPNGEASMTPRSALFVPRPPRSTRRSRRQAVPTEAEIEQLLIFPLLELIGWHYLPPAENRQAARGYSGCLAVRQRGSTQRSAFGTQARGTISARRRGAGKRGVGSRTDRAVGPRTPASQALRYLRLAENGLLLVRWTPSLVCPGQRLELHGAEIAYGRVSPLRVVEALDAVEHIGAGLVAGTVDAAAYSLGLQR